MKKISREESNKNKIINLSENSLKQLKCVDMELGKMYFYSGAALTIDCISIQQLIDKMSSIDSDLYPAIFYFLGTIVSTLFLGASVIEIKNLIKQKKDILKRKEFVEKKLFLDETMEAIENILSKKQNEISITYFPKIKVIKK